MFTLHRDQQSAEGHVQRHAERQCGEEERGAARRRGAGRPATGEALRACERVPRCKQILLFHSMLFLLYILWEAIYLILNT